MCKKTRIWLMVGACLVILGLALFAFAMRAYRWDFTNLSTVKFETVTHTVFDAFRNISVNTDTADITFLPTQDGSCQVVCYEAENVRYTVAVRDGVLTVQQIDEKQWYDYMGITVETPSITVYLPEGAYGDLMVKDHTGDVEISQDLGFESLTISVTTGHVLVSNGAYSGDVNIRVSTGKTMLENVRCKNLISTGDTGDVSAENVIAEKEISICRSTGDVRFDGCDASQIFVETDTGDITGTLLSEKVFLAETDTGEVQVPKTTAGGKCEVRTDTGDIRLEIA